MTWTREVLVFPAYLLFANGEMIVHYFYRQRSAHIFCPNSLYWFCWVSVTHFPFLGSGWLHVPPACGRWQRSRELSVMGPKWYSGSLDTIGLLSHLKMYHIVTRRDGCVRACTEVGSEWLLRASKAARDSLAPDLQYRQSTTLKAFISQSALQKL